MKILMLYPSADPERVLLRGKVYDLPAKIAQELIDAQSARKIPDVEIGPQHTPPSTEPREE